MYIDIMMQIDDISKHHRHMEMQMTTGSALPQSNGGVSQQHGPLKLPPTNKHPEDSQPAIAVNPGGSIVR